MINAIFFSCFLLAATVGVISLQIFLSKKDDRRIGLILPIISFIASLIPAISNTIILLNLKVGPGVEIDFFNSTMIMVYVNAFLLINIITVVLIVIYLSCRKKRNIQRSLDKMSAQDLF